MPSFKLIYPINPVRPRNSIIWKMDLDFELQEAIRRNDFEEVETMIEKGANVNCRTEFNNTCLNLAIIYSSSSSICHLLLENGADINAVDDNDETPLHKAIFYNRFSLAKALIDLGAKGSMMDINGDTPLHLAMKKRQFDIARIIAEKEPEAIFLKNSWGETPIDELERFIELLERFNRNPFDDRLEKAKNLWMFFKTMILRR